MNRHTSRQICASVFVIWSGALILLFGLSGCQRGPTIPESYGTYVERNGKWIAIRTLEQNAVLAPEQRFLIYSPLAAQLPDPQRLAELHPAMWIRNVIEARSDSREAEPTAYHVEPGGGIWIDEAHVFPLDYAPDPKNPKALYVRPRQQLGVGAYALQIVGDTNEPTKVTFWVGSAEPARLSNSSIRDEWVYTLSENAGELSKLGAFVFGPAAGSTGRRDYKGRTVNRNDVKPVEALSELEQQLKARCDRALQAPQSEASLDEAFRAALVYQTLSPPEGGKALADAKARLETPILEAAKQKDWLLVLYYQQLSARYGVGEQAQNAMRDAGRALAEAESKARQSLKVALTASADPGKQIATFTARSTSFSEDDFTIALNEGIVKWREPRYIGGPNDGAIPVREVVSAIAGKDEFPASKVLNPDRPMVKTAEIKYRNNEGSSEERFTFPSVQQRDGFVKGVSAAKVAMEAKYPELFESKVTARPTIWSERILIGDCPWDYAVEKPEGRMELSSDSRDSEVYEPGKDTNLRASDWIRVRSLETRPLQVVVSRFPRLRSAAPSKSARNDTTSDSSPSPAAARENTDQTKTASTQERITEPSTSTAVTSNTMQTYIERRQTLESEQNIDAIMEGYAPWVNYFDNGLVDKAFIKKDKADYFARWPTKSNRSRGRIKMESLDDDNWRVEAPLQFRVENAKGEWIDGDVTQVLVVNTATMPWQIKSENGKITRREKGGTSSPPKTEKPPRPNRTAPVTRTQGRYPYAKSVPGKRGFVISPYSSSGYVDVTGFPRGTEVNDPWTGKIFLAP